MEEKTQKPIIIIDTNFIIENLQDFRDIIEQLKEYKEVYISRVAIDERKGQRFRETKDKYEKIKEFKQKYKGLVSVKEVVSFEKFYSDIEKSCEKTYIQTFNVIPLENGVLQETLDRAYKKMPPFSSDPNASDKGFKDALMWMSILNFFKNKDIPEEIVFISNDKCFNDNKIFLEEEFKTITGNKINIKTNDYYKEIIGKNVVEVKNEEECINSQILEQDKLLFREEISRICQKICYTEVEDSFRTKLCKNFTTSAKFTEEEVNKALINLNQIIMKHIFDNEILISEIFDNKFLDIDDKYYISIKAFEDLNKVYENIKNKYNYLLPQLCYKICEELNRNYEESTVDDDQLPF